MNSYSDACMALVADNIEQIFSSLEKSLQKDMCQPLGFCEEAQLKVTSSLSGARVHLMICFDDSADLQPMRVSVRPLSNDRKFESKFEKSLSSKANVNDELECEFCEALVKNVRTMLVSNTTEEEFVQVLNGLCKQTGSYAKEVRYQKINVLKIKPYPYLCYLPSAEHWLTNTGRRFIRSSSMD